MPRPMVARFGGKCRACGGRINPGDAILFRGKGNSVHASCEPKPVTTPALTNPALKRKIEGDRFVIDWPELKEVTLRAMAGNFSDFPRSRETAEYYCRPGGVSDRWLGYSLAQAKDWCVNGYHDAALEGLENFAPPIREKRRFVYSDEGDEIDLSAAWAGEDNFMTEWTKRETIPGIALEFEICLVCSTPAAVVNEYERWIARACEAIESAGIDPEINIAFPGEAEWGHGEQSMRLVRVKREGETVDLQSWSAMLSPATFRTFGFVTYMLDGEAHDKAISTGICRSHGGTQWRCYYDADECAIRTECPYMPHEFPEEEMTKQLREAIEALKRDESN